MGRGPERAAGRPAPGARPVPPPPRVLVLAVGNPLRRDDGAAPAAVRGLEAARPDLDVVIAHQLLPEHADLVRAAGGVIFADAREGSPPGTVAVEEVAAEAGPPALAHALGPAALLALARAAYGAAPPAAAVSVAAADFSLGEGLSPEVERAIPEMRAAIVRVRDGWMGGGRRADRA